MKVIHVSLALALGLPGVSAAAAKEDRQAAPTYTNADLERMAPRRAETGVESVPAFRLAAPERSAPAGRGEAYWRREAERLEDRLRPLRARVAALRRRIDERWRKPGVQPVTDPQLVEWRRQLRETEEEMAFEQARVEDRARREGALPGWLR